MIRISSMEIENIPDAINLWKTQFNNYCYCNIFPNFIDGGHMIIESYIKEQVKKDNAIVAKIDNAIVGFMAWMCFDFHFDDDILKNSLFESGFGSYVIDACQSTCVTGVDKKLDYRISFASTKDVDALIEFASFSNEYYSSSPIFLKRSEYTKDEIMELINKDYALIAWDNEEIIGVMSFTINQDFHFEHLTTPNSAYIKCIGAFIRPDYRGKGIGTALLEKAFAFCNQKGKTYLHESINAKINPIRQLCFHFPP